MKKLFIIVTLFFVSVSLFSQESEESKDPKNIMRIQAETLFINGTHPDYRDNDVCEYAIIGFGINYSRLFSENIGMTFALSTLVFAIDDPFNTNGTSNFNALGNRYGAIFKVGPYFQFGKIGFSPTLDIGSIVKSTNDDYFGVLDQLIGVSLGLDFFVTDVFLIHIEGGVLLGSRFDEDSLLWDSPDDESSSLMACQLTIGAGFAF